jgi:hypothetical protein
MIHLADKAWHWRRNAVGPPGRNEDVEDDQLFLAYVFANVALLFLGWVAAQLHQFLEQFPDALAARVIAYPQAGTLNIARCKKPFAAKISKF